MNIQLKNFFSYTPQSIVIKGITEVCYNVNSTGENRISFMRSGSVNYRYTTLIVLKYYTVKRIFIR